MQSENDPHRARTTSTRLVDAHTDDAPRRRVARAASQSLSAGLLVAFALAVYFVAARYPWRPPLATHLSIDDHVPLWPAFVFVYLSPYVVGPFVAALLPAALFRRMLARAFALLPLQLGAYFALPTMVLRPPPPDGDAVAAAALRAIYAVDSPPLNAAPSGHVSLAFLIAWAAWHAWPRGRAVSVSYFSLVVVSILFTGQHHVVDLVTGAALGGGVLFLMSRRERVRPDPATNVSAAERRQRSSRCARPHDRETNASSRDRRR